jgi:hypothetical protein
MNLTLKASVYPRSHIIPGKGTRPKTHGLGIGQDGEEFINILKAVLSNEQVLSLNHRPHSHDFATSLP